MRHVDLAFALVLLAGCEGADRPPALPIATLDASVLDDVEIDAGVEDVVMVDTREAGPPKVTTVDVTPPTAWVMQGSKHPFKATANFSDGAALDVTSAALWTSSDPTNLSVNEGVVLLSSGCGTFVIRATYQGVSGTASLSSECLKFHIEVTPKSALGMVGTTQAFVATGVYNDGTTVVMTSSATWSSSEVSVATIDEKGVATPLANGKTTITAKVGSVLGEATYEVR